MISTYHVEHGTLRLAVPIPIELWHCLFLPGIVAILAQETLPNPLDSIMATRSPRPRAACTCMMTPVFMKWFAADAPLAGVLELTRCRRGGGGG